MERIVNSFVSHMDQALRGQFQNLARVMDETCRAQQSANESMQAALHGFTSVTGDITAVQRASQAIVEKFEGYLNSLNAAQTAQDERGEQMSQQIEAMQKAAREQARYINQLQDYLIKLQKGMDEYSQQSAEFIKQFGETATSGQQMMREAGTALEEGAKSLSSAAEVQVTNLENNLAKLLASMDKALGEVTQQLGWTITSIKESVDQLPKVVNDSAQSYASEMARFVESVRYLQRSLDAALANTAPAPDYNRRRVE